MEKGAIGKVYSDGEIIIRQGEKGDCLYVIQDGCVEVLKAVNGLNTRLAVLGKGDFFGEMAVLEDAPRTATVRALGNARILTIDKRLFLQRLHEDPALAYRFMCTMSRRIRKLCEEVASFEFSLQGSILPPEPAPSLARGNEFRFFKLIISSLKRGACSLKLTAGRPIWSKPKGLDTYMAYKEGALP